ARPRPRGLSLGRREDAGRLAGSYPPGRRERWSCARGPRDCTGAALPDGDARGIRRTMNDAQRDALLLAMAKGVHALLHYALQRGAPDVGQEEHMLGEAIAAAEVERPTSEQS